MKSSLFSVVAVVSVAASQLAQAQDVTENSCEAQTGCASSYPASFFAQFRPVTALDMVRRLPGFQIADGEETRGFGGASGNILINGERPSAKSDTVSDILERIPAESVSRIDVIRGPFARSDLRGQTLVASVYLKPQSAGVLTWESGGDILLRSNTFSPFASISYSGEWNAAEYVFGVSVEQDRDLLSGAELLTDEIGAPAEFRDETEREKGREIVVSLSSNFDLAGGRASFNGRGATEKAVAVEISDRTPVNVGLIDYTVLQSSTKKLRSFEAGVDYEKALPVGWNVKILGLYRRDRLPEFEELSDPDPAVPGRTELSISTVRARTSELIGRTAVEYDGVTGHLIEGAVEAARNTLDNRQMLIVDEGGGFLPEIVPGANASVSEERVEASLQDSWRLGALTLETGLGIEASTIRQSGDVASSQSLFYVRPSLSALYARTGAQQFQASFRREVAQLDFFDFVSASDFDDQDLALGNPELRPETTWVAEVALRQRFGEAGALNLALYRHWVSDVQDLLPLQDGDETPGNIGDGHRWGVKADGALPLDWAGLSNARLDFEGEWRRSRVIDPVTGAARRFSNEQRWIASAEFRQDFTEQRWAWGWELDLGAPEFEFGLDEFVRSKEGADLDLYWESTWLKSVKLRIELKNMLRGGDSRLRTRFDGARDLSPVALEELRDRHGARALSIVFSGTI